MLRLCRVDTRGLAVFPEEPRLTGRLLSAAHLASRYGCSVEAINAMVAAGKLPAPVIFRRRLYFHECEVDAYDALLRV
jgi:hypothetical protein